MLFPFFLFFELVPFQSNNYLKDKTNSGSKVYLEKASLT